MNCAARRISRESLPFVTRNPRNGDNFPELIPTHLAEAELESARFSSFRSFTAWVWKNDVIAYEMIEASRCGADHFASGIPPPKHWIEGWKTCYLLLFSKSLVSAAHAGLPL